MNISANNQREKDEDSINWEEVGLKLPTNALEQSGDKVNPYDSPQTELRVLRGATLLRLHGLQSLTDLNTALTPENVQLPGIPLQSLGQDPKAMSLAPGEWLLFSEFLDSSRLLDTVLPVVDNRCTRVLDL